MPLVASPYTGHLVLSFIQSAAAGSSQTRATRHLRIIAAPPFGRSDSSVPLSARQVLHAGKGNRPVTLAYGRLAWAAKGPGTVPSRPPAADCAWDSPGLSLNLWGECDFFNSSTVPSRQPTADSLGRATTFSGAAAMSRKSGTVPSRQPTADSLGTVPDFPFENSSALRKNRRTPRDSRVE